MGLQLTQLASDNFTRANVNPLSSPWSLDAYGDPGLQIVSDFCEPINTEGYSQQYYSYSLPNDQYASVTVHALSYLVFVGVRMTDNDSSDEPYSCPGYIFRTYSGYWQVFANGNVILSGSGITVNPGDVFTIAVVGTTVYAFQNSTQLGSVTNTAYSSGSANLGALVLGGTTQFSNFAIGSASVTSTYSISGNAGVASALVSYSGTASGSVSCDSSGNYSISGLANGSYTITPSLAGYTFSPTTQSETINNANISGVNFTASDPPSGNLHFLGSVTEGGFIPSGQSQIFLGTVKVVSSPPTGLGNPYLGHMNIGSPPGSQTNPVLGEVVVVATPPAGPPDPWLGIVETE